MNLNLIRPSTLARVVEDTVLNGFKNIAHGAQSAKRSITNEYNARYVVSLQRNIEEQAAKIAAMTPEQRRRFEYDQALVGARIAQLMDKQSARAARKAARNAVREAKRKAKSKSA